MPMTGEYLTTFILLIDRYMNSCSYRTDNEKDIPRGSVKTQGMDMSINIEKVVNFSYGTCHCRIFLLGICADSYELAIRGFWVREMALNFDVIECFP